jgi:hemoglobin
VRLVIPVAAARLAAARSLPPAAAMTIFTCSAAVAPEAEKLSAYEAIGGRAAVAAAVDLFYRRLLDDPVLGPFLPGGVGVRYRAYVVTILGEALGGPERYRGDMVGAHRGLGISDAHFDRAAAHLGATLDELGIPGDLTDRIIAIAAGPARPGCVHRGAMAPR